MEMKFTITENMTHDRKPSRNTSRARKRDAKNTAPTQFICVDGEGVTLPDGTHRYVLLGVGDQQIANEDGLSWQECFEFLWSQFRYGNYAYTGFFLSYDFIQILKTLKEERARMLLTAEGRAKRAVTRSELRRMPFPVQCEGWEFDILGSKRLKIRKAGSDRWMSICDAGPFFQKSFLAVIDPKEWSEPVVTQEEFDTVTAGKSRRGSAVLDADMRRYNALENEILARVLCQLDTGFKSLGIHLRPGQWFGPGQAASAWLKNRAITTAEVRQVVPAPALEAARESYFGGWFEIMAHGLVPGVTHEYDINSAYPHIIRGLPCLKHGEWRHNDRHHYERPSWSLVRAAVHNASRHVGAMLHRDDSGNISRPNRTEGWYWLHELEASARALGTEYEITESWTYLPCDCRPPLGEVAGIYALRQRVGKKTPLGIACKLVPNSLYGKFAQSVGTPQYGNPVYASLITSGCRVMILDAIATHPDGARAVLMVATDGVYFSKPHPSLPVSGALGDWDSDEKSNLCLFKPGVYWDDKARARILAGDAPVFKARGVNARDFAAKISSIDTAFRELSVSRPSRVSWPSVEFPIQFSMVTALQALHRNQWGLAGTLVPDPTARQSADPSLKRSSWHWDGPLLRSKPVENEPYTPSRPYDKRFGIEVWSQEAMEAGGVTPDGYPGELWKEALHG
jgi:hypothetical protein